MQSACERGKGGESIELRMDLTDASKKLFDLVRLDEHVVHTRSEGAVDLALPSVARESNDVLARRELAGGLELSQLSDAGHTVHDRHLRSDKGLRRKMSMWREGERCLETGFD
jgi:hypothetical protein